VAVAAVILLVGAGVGVGLRLSSGSGDASSNLEYAIQATFPHTQAECEHRSGSEYVCVVGAQSRRILTNDNGHTYVDEGPA
jgi:hypothetical protein